MITTELFLLALFAGFAILQVIQIRNSVHINKMHKTLKKLNDTRKAREDKIEPRFTALMMSLSLEDRFKARFPELAQSINRQKQV